MILRVVLFRLKSEVSDYDTRLLMTSVSSAVKSVPGLLSFNVGRRVESEGGYTIGDAPGGPAGGPFDYAAVFQFEGAKALQAYLRHPAHAEIRSRFSGVVASAVSCDYEI